MNKWFPAERFDASGDVREFRVGASVILSDVDVVTIFLVIWFCQKNFGHHSSLLDFLLRSDVDFITPFCPSHKPDNARGYLSKLSRFHKYPPTPKIRFNYSYDGNLILHRFIRASIVMD